MPKYDLAGNPLPEPTSPNGSGPLPGQGLPHPGQAPQRNFPPAYSPPMSQGGQNPSSDVRYDLAGNVLPPLNTSQAPPAAGPYGSPLPQSRHLTPQPGGTWPPPPTIGSPYAAQQKNTSGERGEVPVEIARLKWNWGAFSLTFLWCLNHKLVPAGLVIFIGNFVLNHFIGLWSVPVAYAFYIYFGIMGHKFAWRNRHFAGGIPEYFAVQRAWMKWGIALFILNILILPAILFPAFERGRMNAQQMQNPGYNQPYGGSQPGSPGVGGSNTP